MLKNSEGKVSTTCCSAQWELLRAGRTVQNRQRVYCRSGDLDFNFWADITGIIFRVPHISPQQNQSISQLMSFLKLTYHKTYLLVKKKKKDMWGKKFSDPFLKMKKKSQVATEINTIMSKPSILVKQPLPLEESLIQIYLTDCSARVVVYLLWEVLFTACTSRDSITARTKGTQVFTRPGLYLGYSDFSSWLLVCTTEELWLNVQWKTKKEILYLDCYILNIRFF